MSLKKGARITYEMIFKLRSSQIERRTRRPGFFLEQMNAQLPIPLEPLYRAQQLQADPKMEAQARVAARARDEAMEMAR